MPRKAPSTSLIHTVHAANGLLILAGLLMLAAFRGSEPETFNIPKLIGHTDTTALCLSPNYMLNAWYSIERMDTISDTLDLSLPGKDHRTAVYPFWESPEHEQHKQRSFSNKGLRLVADTVNELSMMKRPIWARYLFHRNLSDSTEVLQDDTLIQRVKSFPIYLVNASTNDCATIDIQDGSLIMVVQAQDQKGRWKPIEYWSNSWCGNSYFTQVIRPRHLLMTRGIKCSGSFATRCRLLMANHSDTLYSNSFSMHINETQFNQPVQKDRWR